MISADLLRHCTQRPPELLVTDNLMLVCANCFLPAHLCLRILSLRLILSPLFQSRMLVLICGLISVHLRFILFPFVQASYLYALIYKLMSVPSLIHVPC